MGFDGAGGYDRQRNFSADASAGIKILASAMDQELDDMASAFALCWTINGQNTPTSAIAMGGNRFTGVGAASSVTNYLRADQYVKQVPIYMVDAESVDTTNVSVSAQFFTSVSANQAPSDGTKIAVRMVSDKSASCAFHFNGGGGTAHSANIYNASGSAIGDLALVSGGIYEFVYNSAIPGWQATNAGQPKIANFASANVGGSPVMTTGNFKVKTTDTTRTSTNSLADDPHLAGWTVKPGKLYKLDGYVEIQTGASAGFKFNWAFTQTPQDGQFGLFYENDSGDGVLDDVGITAGAFSLNAATQTGIQLRGQFHAHASTTATLDFQWAAVTTTADNTIVRKGSWVEIVALGSV